MNIRICIALFFLLSIKAIWSQNEAITTFKIKPSATDTRIIQGDIEHLVMYDANVDQGKLFLFLPGTNGIPERGPVKLFKTAIDQGYRVINLSYLNKLAVARICRGENLENNTACTEKFREQRVFGNQNTFLIPDKPQDAIVSRFTALLKYLITFNPEGNWEVYLDGDTPKWDDITVSGQSQGGGMAVFIAKRKLVAKVITFSGGWDYAEKGVIADWYSYKSITPSEKWYGFYHTKEPKAIDIDKTYRAMHITDSHIYALDLPVREGKRAHGEGIRNTVYAQLWIDILGNGILAKK